MDQILIHLAIKDWAYQPILKKKLSINSVLREWWQHSGGKYWNYAALTSKRVKTIPNNNSQDRRRRFEYRVYSFIFDYYWRNSVLVWTWGHSVEIFSTIYSIRYAFIPRLTFIRTWTDYFLPFIGMNVAGNFINFNDYCVCFELIKIEV